MTEKEKRTILDMRAAGRQYKEISEKLGIDVSALKVFVHTTTTIATSGSWRSCPRGSITAMSPQGSIRSPEIRQRNRPLGALPPDPRGLSPVPQGLRHRYWLPYGETQ